MERVKTGITGLDEIIQGGFPKGASILVSGGTGCGKSIFAMQYIYNGAKLYNEPGLFVTLETNLKNITWDMQNFSWDIKPLQDAGMMKIYRLNLGISSDAANIEDQIDAELEAISAMVKELGIKRIVIDSTTAFGVWVREEGKLRGTLYKFIDALKDLDCTTLLTAEVRGDKHNLSAFGVEEFVADGVVVLYLTPPFRSLFVRKMRGTNHSKKIHPLDITAQGMKVSPKDEIMWDAVK